MANCPFLCRLLLGSALAIGASSALASGNHPVPGHSGVPDYNAIRVIGLAGPQASDSLVFVTALNNAGQLVGNSWGSGAFRATIWDNLVPSELGILNAHSSAASGINERGQSVGYDDTGILRPLFWNGSTQIRLPVFGHLDGEASAINNAGQIVGRTLLSYGGAAGVVAHATLWDRGTLTDLSPGATVSRSAAEAINNAGVIAGYIDNAAVRWTGTSATVLGSLGGAVSRAHDINDAGQIVGESNDVEGAAHAVIWNDNAATVLESLGCCGVAYGINNLGDVVGSVRGGAIQTRAALWHHGSVIDLNQYLDAASVAEGWTLTHAFDINDNGMIIANAFKGMTGQHRNYVLVPVPEPATVLMLSAGLGLLGLFHRRLGPR